MIIALSFLKNQQFVKNENTALIFTFIRESEKKSSFIKQIIASE